MDLQAKPACKSDSSARFGKIMPLFGLGKPPRAMALAVSSRFYSTEVRLRRMLSIRRQHSIEALLFARSRKWPTTWGWLDEWTLIRSEN